MRALSDLFNKRMAKHFGLVGPASVTRLFKKMLAPVDGKVWGDVPERTGSICFGDFERVVRTQLRLGHAAMPQVKLLALWKALDADGSGLVCQGEWGRFMRFGGAETNVREGRTPPAPRRSRVPAADENDKIRVRRERERQLRDERYVLQVARQTQDKVNSLEREAARLEAMLHDDGGASAAPLRLPRI